MVLWINGMDLTHFIQEGGYKYQLNDIEAPDAGRTLDGVMHRGRVSQKVRLDITCRQLTTLEISAVLKVIDPEFVEVAYLDPKEGREVTKTFYSNNKPATCLIQFSDGDEKWGSFSFPLVEK